MNEDTAHITGEENSIYAFADLVRRLQDEEEQVEETSLWVLFRVADRRFAIAISSAREIHRVGEIIPVPDAPPAARGVVQLRGRVLALIDLAVRLDLGKSEIDSASRVVVVESRGRLIGVLVDGVDRVVELEESRLAERPAEYLPELADLMTGVARIDARTVGLLDVDQVLIVGGS